MLINIFVLKKLEYWNKINLFQFAYTDSITKACFTYKYWLFLLESLIIALTFCPFFSNFGYYKTEFQNID